MKNIYLILIALLLINGCKKDFDCGDQSDIIITYNIPDSIKNLVPYKGYDTLVFVSDNNDTSVLISGAKRNYYTNVEISAGTVDCPRNHTTKYGTIDLTFKGSNLKFNELFYKIIKSRFDVKYTGVEIIINKISEFGAFAEYQFYKQPTNDSIYYNNKFILGDYIDYSNKYLLYNNEFGILKIRNISNTNWTLINKK